jgi:hypothetical protein
VSVVESKLRFFEVEKKGVLRHTLELGQAVLGEAPKRLDTVDVVAAISELVLTVTNPEMFRISDVDKSVVSNPTVGVYNRIEADSTPDKPLQSTFLRVWNDLSPYPVSTFEDAKHDRLLTCASASFAFDPMWTEVRLIDLDRPAERSVGLTDSDQAAPNLEEDIVHRTHADTSHTSCRTGRQVLPETAKNLAKFGLGNFRRSTVLVNPCHYVSIAPLHWRFAS